MSQPDNKIPVTVLTGFLGSGKTTVLNHLVHQPEMARALVIINEFGEVGLDHMLVTHSAEQGIVQMSSGCLCCTIRTDLVQTLKNIAWRFSIRGERLFDRVIIETTGLADPAPIVHTLIAEPTVIEHYRLDGIVTVVDSVHGSSSLDANPEAMRQVVVADKILLTKHDLVESQVLERLEQRLASMNPAAPRLVISDGIVPPNELLGLGLFDPQTRPADVGRWLAEQAHAHVHDHHQDVNRHSDQIKAACYTFDAEVDESGLTDWFEGLASEIGDRLLRLKGLLRTSNPNQPLVVHAVQHVMHPPKLLTGWPDDDWRSKLVLITRDVDTVHLDALVEKLKR